MNITDKGKPPARAQAGGTPLPGEVNSPITSLAFFRDNNTVELPIIIGFFDATVLDSPVTLWTRSRIQGIFPEDQLLCHDDLLFDCQGAPCHPYYLIPVQATRPLVAWVSVITRRLLDLLDNATARKTSITESTGGHALNIAPKGKIVLEVR